MCGNSVVHPLILCVLLCACLPTNEFISASLSARSLIQRCHFYVHCRGTDVVNARQSKLKIHRNLLSRAKNHNLVVVSQLCNLHDSVAVGQQVLCDRFFSPSGFALPIFRLLLALSFFRLCLTILETAMLSVFVHLALWSSQVVFKQLSKFCTLKSASEKCNAP